MLKFLFGTFFQNRPDLRKTPQSSRKCSSNEQLRTESHLFSLCSGVCPPAERMNGAPQRAWKESFSEFWQCIIPDGLPLKTAINSPLTLWCQWGMVMLVDMVSEVTLRVKLRGNKSLLSCCWPERGRCFSFRVFFFFFFWSCRFLSFLFKTEKFYNFIWKHSECVTWCFDACVIVWCSTCDLFYQLIIIKYSSVLFCFVSPRRHSLLSACA